MKQLPVTVHGDPVIGGMVVARRLCQIVLFRRITQPALKLHSDRIHRVCARREIRPLPPEPVGVYMVDETKHLREPEQTIRCEKLASDPGDRTSTRLNSSHHSSSY